MTQQDTRRKTERQRRWGLLIRLNRAERRIVQKKAKAAGKLVAVYIRDQAVAAD